jgi:hypothetical protein
LSINYCADRTIIAREFSILRMKKTMKRANSDEADHAIQFGGGHPTSVRFRRIEVIMFSVDWIGQAERPP